MAPLAPIAFKALADLGKKIPKIAEMAEKWVPKIAAGIGAIFKGIDMIGKFFRRDWAKWAALLVAGLVAINLTLKMGRLTGSVLGLRSGGAARGAIQYDYGSWSYHRSNNSNNNSSERFLRVQRGCGSSKRRRSGG